MKKKNKLTISQRLSNATELPMDMMPSRPYIHLCSNREAIIEDAGKLLHYNENRIKVRQGKNAVELLGNGLVIKYLKNNDLRVTGFIATLNFE